MPDFNTINDSFRKAADMEAETPINTPNKEELCKRCEQHDKYNVFLIKSVSLIMAPAMGYAIGHEYGPTATIIGIIVGLIVGIWITTGWLEACFTWLFRKVKR